MLYILVGNGNGNKREVMASLGSIVTNGGLIEPADENDTFWMAVNVEEKPSDTVTAIMEWANKAGVYYEAVEDETIIDPPPLYSEAQYTHSAKRPYDRLVKLTGTRLNPGEKAAILVLDDDVDNSENVLFVINESLRNGIPAYSISGEMFEFTLAPAEELEIPPANAFEATLAALSPEPEPQRLVDIPELNDAEKFEQELASAEDDGPEYASMGEYMAAKEAAKGMGGIVHADVIPADITQPELGESDLPPIRQVELPLLRSVDLEKLNRPSLKLVVDEYGVRSKVKDMRNKADMISALMWEHGYEDDPWFNQAQPTTTQAIDAAISVSSHPTANWPTTSWASPSSTSTITPATGEEIGMVDLSAQPEVVGTLYFLMVVSPDGTVKMRAINSYQAEQAVNGSVF